MCAELAAAPQHELVEYSPSAFLLESLAIEILWISVRGGQTLIEDRGQDVGGLRACGFSHLGEGSILEARGGDGLTPVLELLAREAVEQVKLQKATSEHSRAVMCACAISRWRSNGT
jgi:hypothetical protein